MKIFDRIDFVGGAASRAVLRAGGGLTAQSIAYTVARELLIDGKSGATAYEIARRSALRFLKTGGAA